METGTEPIDTQCISQIHNAVPDPPGGRFCKQCSDWRPVNSFPAGVRRHTCNLHRWEKFGKMAKSRYFAHGEHKLLFKLWVKIYSDAKHLQSVWDDTHMKPGSHTAMRVKITQKQIKLLLHCMVDTFKLTSTMCDMYNDLVELGKNTAIVPISANEIVSLENAALVTSPVKRSLLRAFRLDGLEGYSRALRMAEAQTNSVFRPSKEQLCQMQETLVSNNNKPLFSDF